ncbi:MAG TPA: DUF2780 domain-containing protein [Vicinamibacteria bacterium]
MAKGLFVRPLLAAVMAATTTSLLAQEPAAAPPDKDVAATASPELVGHLTRDLAITATQAEGGAGAVFAMAKKRLKPEDYGKVTAAVPGIEALIAAAPLPDPKSAALDIASQGAGVASLASSLGKLGLKPEMALKIVPAISGHLKGRGASDAAQLVGGLLK